MAHFTGNFAADANGNDRSAELTTKPNPNEPMTNREATRSKTDWRRGARSRHYWSLAIGHWSFGSENSRRYS
jgi:hypothetical protein